MKTLILVWYRSRGLGSGDCRLSGPFLPSEVKNVFTLLLDSSQELCTTVEGFAVPGRGCTKAGTAFLHIVTAAGTKNRRSRQQQTQE